MNLYIRQGKEMIDDFHDQVGIIGLEIELIIFRISSIPEQGGDINADVDLIVRKLPYLKRHEEGNVAILEEGEPRL